MLLHLIACAEAPIPAPAELGDIVLGLFREWEQLEAADELPTWLAEDWNDADPGWTMPALSADEVDGLDIPARDLADALGGAVAAESEHSLESHAAFILLADQSVVNPTDYERYDREFTEGGECFADASCDVLRTWNVVVKNGAFGVQIPYEWEKDYRRVAGEGFSAIIARGWLSEEAWAEDDANGLLQSYTVDAFVEWEGGPLIRLQSQWTELALVLQPDDEFLYNQLIEGIRGVFEDTDAAIAGAGL